MAKNRTPQTFEKRQRERKLQLKREAKKAARLARNAEKREDGGPSGAPVIDADSMFQLPEDQVDRPDPLESPEE